MLSPRRWAIVAIYGYRYLISPLFPNHCRFYPTCSHYAEEAIATHGLRRGIALAARRLLKCHPGHPGGVDPVPPAACRYPRCSETTR